jgi:hypothetical protein
MAYLAKYKTGAKDEQEQLQSDYGAEFAADLDRWIGELCADSGSRAYRLSASLEGFLNDCQQSWIEFQKAGFANKLTTLWAALTRRSPPWEFRIASDQFRLLGIIPVVIQAVFAVDHANGRIIFHLIELSDHDSPTI